MLAKTVMFRIIAQRTQLLPSLKWHLLGRTLHLSHGLLANKSYYDILGVTRSATNREIKTAYFALAKRYHPDANPGDPNAAKRFQELSEAYSVLSDHEKRQNYDFFGNNSSSTASGQTYRQGPNFGDFNQYVKSQSSGKGYNFYYKGNMSPVEAQKMFEKILSEFEKSMGSMQGINISNPTQYARKNPIKSTLINMALNFLVRKFIERLFGGKNKKIRGRK